eukprot:TRINITY_DN12770_c0_g1_i1.p1 TRINITY_DN12770_c0_g1~~TRINITY_DN12770_c0_g1_i1.p1  ORF type:complete len:216 (+),score=28.23 TRINITY_DN12770_c0_g1_i1:56-703(+)
MGSRLSKRNKGHKGLNVTKKERNRSQSVTDKRRSYSAGVVPSVAPLPDYDHLFKVIFLGEANVGKTALVLRYTDGVFTEKFVNTMGVDSKSKDLKVNGQVIRLQLWDTAGQERFRIITSTYFRGAVAVVLVFDVSDETSFDHIPRWFQDATKNCENTYNVLVGNKTDLERKVTYEKALAFATSKGMRYFETSAKTNSHVDEVFTHICSKALEAKK